MKENGFLNSENTDRVNKYFGASAASLTRLAALLGECESVEDVQVFIARSAIVAFIALAEARSITDSNTVEVIGLLSNVFIDFSRVKSAYSLKMAKERLDSALYTIAVKLSMKESRE